jgi:hypothetical protein
MQTFLGAFRNLRARLPGRKDWEVWEIKNTHPVILCVRQHERFIQREEVQAIAEAHYGGGQDFLVLIWVYPDHKEVRAIPVEKSVTCRDKQEAEALTGKKLNRPSYIIRPDRTFYIGPVMLCELTEANDRWNKMALAQSAAERSAWPFRPVANPDLNLWAQGNDVY